MTRQTIFDKIEKHGKHYRFITELLDQYRELLYSDMNDCGYMNHNRFLEPNMCNINTTHIIGRVDIKHQNLLCEHVLINDIIKYFQRG